ncbi:hypothetical protein [Kitasatospora phosalacinea]|uniref:hypothetical protein n=1 Tax=Kitasatospora phosalacinea TaxID=2065 RepID=UPI000AD5C757|nr:hypothetical protein [Kitasatospora phosalacinea]
MRDGANPSIRSSTFPGAGAIAVEGFGAGGRGLGDGEGRYDGEHGGPSGPARSAAPAQPSAPPPRSTPSPPDSRPWSPDRYRAEAQALGQEAEARLLELAELRGTLTTAQAQRRGTVGSGFTAARRP